MVLYTYLEVIFFQCIVQIQKFVNILFRKRVRKKSVSKTEVNVQPILFTKLLSFILMYLQTHDLKVCLFMVFMDQRAYDILYR